MSEFASTDTAIDMKEQTRATVDAAAKLEEQIIFEQSEFDSLRQVYGDENVRLRSARARVSELQHQLQVISGTSAPLEADKSPIVEITNSRGSLSLPLWSIALIGATMANQRTGVEIHL